MLCSDSQLPHLLPLCYSGPIWRNSGIYSTISALWWKTSTYSSLQIVTHLTLLINNRDIERWRPLSGLLSVHNFTSSNPRYSWVTYFILSNFCNFSQLVLPTHLCSLYQFCHLIYLSMTCQTYVIFSPLVIYSLFTLSSHPINAPAVHTTNTTLPPVLLCARSLRPNTFLTHQASLAIVPFWYGGIETWLGVSS